MITSNPQKNQLTSKLVKILQRGAKKPQEFEAQAPSKRFSLRSLRNLGALCGLRFSLSEAFNRKARKEPPAGAKIESRFLKRLSWRSLRGLCALCGLRFSLSKAFNRKVHQDFAKHAKNLLPEQNRIEISSKGFLGDLCASFAASAV